MAQDIDSTNKRLQEQINSIRQNAQPYNGQHFIQEMLEYAHISSREWFIPDNPIPLLACERVALRFMLENSSFAADFLTEEELEKAKATFARGQYTSGLLKKLLQYFFGALIRIRSEAETKSHDSIHNLFTLSLLEEYRRTYAEEAEKSFKPLKRQVDKIASGVNGSCYFHSESLFGEAECLTDTLNSYVIHQFGYDYNTYHYSARSIHSYLLPGSR
jgi:hypothetical protein